jgi:L-lactate utilization protein LutB
MDYKQIPSDQIINQTIEALKAHGMSVLLVENKNQALSEVKKIIPAGSKIMNGSSTTLNEIGFSDMVNSEASPWTNLRAAVLKEPDMVKRFDLRRKYTVEADYFLSSVNAITEQGQLVAVDGTGSRVGAMPFVAKKLLIIASANKIVPDLDAAFKRIREYVFPLEDARMMKMSNSHTSFGKWVIVENEKDPTRIQLILVKEALGF